MIWVPNFTSAYETVKDSDFSIIKAIMKECLKKMTTIIKSQNHTPGICQTFIKFSHKENKTLQIQNFFKYKNM